VEGRNVAIEFRWAERHEQLLEMASDLVRQRVSLIATPVSTQATLAAKAAAAATTPIVFAVTAIKLSERGLDNFYRVYASGF
jgi:putative tryptophan/tyrosine transport system substrate-binding protein